MFSVGSAQGRASARRGHPRRDGPDVGLTDPEGGHVALHDAAGADDIGAEVDEPDDDALPPDCFGDGRRRHAVLEAHHPAVIGQPVAQQPRRRRRVVALHGDGGVRDPVRQPVGCHGRHPHRELVDRPLDAQAAPVDRLDVGGVGVTEQDVVTGPGHVGADRPADRPGADDRQLHSLLWCSRLTRLPPPGALRRARRE